jgi:hypothetical protein
MSLIRTPSHLCADCIGLLLRIAIGLFAGTLVRAVLFATAKYNICLRTSIAAVSLAAYPA